MSGAEDQPTPPVSRVDHVYNELRRAIIDGEYAPGSPLRVPSLSEDFGVSLIPIREALRKLEVERLLETVPNKGAKVAGISQEDVVDLYNSRQILEEAALRQAWPKIDRELVEHLRKLTASMIAAVAKGEPAYDFHREIHFALYERSGSPWLLYLIEILWSHTERYRRLAAQLREFVDVGEELHSLVIDRIEAGDREGAVAALRDDLLRTVNLILAAPL